MNITPGTGKKNLIIILPILLTGLLTLSGCQSRAAKAYSETRFLLDTVCTVIVYDPADQPLLAEALDLCAQYESLLSRTMEGSDIWRVNHAGGTPLEVNAETAALIQAGLDYGDFSGGLFDITIGRVSALWDFGGAPAVPEAAALAAALNTVDYRQVILSGTTARLTNAGAWLDLGGIAKGFIADRLANFLRQQGVKSAIIDLGGNILTVGAKPGQKPWRIGLEMPFSDRRQLIGSLNVGEASIVTSGIYERQFTQSGVPYHHILDPASGMPVASDVISATVITESSVVGDALSTILILTGSAKAAELLAQTPGLTGAVLMLRSGEIVQYGDIDFTASSQGDI